MGLLDILSQYAQRRDTPPPHVMEDFDQVANEATAEDFEAGLEDAFNSDVTPPFEQMLGQLYTESDDDTRAEVVNELVSSIGDTSQAATAFGGGVAGGVLADLLRRGAKGGPRISPADAHGIPARDIEIAAAQARRQNPGIIQKISRFYARNPRVVQVLGQAAMAILMRGMAKRRRF